MTDIFTVKADVSQYISALQKATEINAKLLDAESKHLQVLSSLSAAEVKFVSGVKVATASGDKLSSAYKKVNDTLSSTLTKMDALSKASKQSTGTKAVLGLASQKDVSSLDAKGLAKYSTSLTQVKKLIDEGKIAGETVKDLWNKLTLGDTTKATGKLLAVQEELRKIKKLQDSINTTPVLQQQQATLKPLRDLTVGLGSKNTSIASQLGSAYADKPVSDRNESLKKLRDAQISAETKLNADLANLHNKYLQNIAGLDAKRLQDAKAKSVEFKRLKVEEAQAVKDAAKKYSDPKSAEYLKAVESSNKRLAQGTQTLANQRLAIDTAYNASVSKLASDRVGDEKKKLDRLLDQRKEYVSKVLQEEKRLSQRLKDQQDVKKADTFKAAGTSLVGTLPIGPKAAAGNIIDFNSAKDKLASFLAANAKGVADQRIKISELNKVWGEVAKGNIHTYTGEVDKLQKLIYQLRLAHSKVTEESLHSSNVQIRESHALSGALQAQKEKLLGVTLSWQSMFRMIVSQVSSRILTSFISDLQQANETVLELSKRFAGITTLDDTNTPVSAWAAGIRELAENSGIDIIDQTKSAYEALSNQIGNGTEALSFLREANDLAIVGFTTATTAQNLLADAIHAWGLEVTDTHEIAAKFFKIVDLGRVTIEEMAPNLGRSSVLAAQLGVSLDELGAAVTTTTIKGVKFETASTFIRNILLKLAKPSDDLATLMHNLGYASGEAWVAAKGLGGVLSDLENNVKGSSTLYAELFRDIRAISGATIFAGQGLKNYEKSLAEISKATETYDAQVKKVKDSLGQDWDKASVKIKDIFVFDTNPKFLTYLSEVTDRFDTLVTATEYLRNGLAALAGGAIPFLVLGLGALILSIGKLSLHLAKAFGPIGVVVSLIASAYGAWESYHLVTTQTIEEANNKTFKEWMDHYNDIIEVSKKASAEIKKSAEDSFTEGLRPVRTAMAQIERAWASTEKVTKKTLEQMGRDVAKAQQLGIDGVNSLLDKYKEKLEGLKADIKSLKDASAKNKQDRDKVKLDKDLYNKTDLQKVIILEEKLKKAKSLRNAATTKEDFEARSAEVRDLIEQKRSAAANLTTDPGSVLKAFNDTGNLLQGKYSVYRHSGDTKGMASIMQQYQTLQDVFNSNESIGINGSNFNTLENALSQTKNYLENIKQGGDYFQIQAATDNVANLEAKLKALAGVFQDGTARRQFDIEENNLIEEEKKRAELIKTLQGKEVKTPEDVKGSVSEVQDQINKYENIAKDIAIKAEELAATDLKDLETVKEATKVWERKLEIIKEISGLYAQMGISSTPYNGLVDDIKKQQGETFAYSKKTETIKNVETGIFEQNESLKAASADLNQTTNDLTKFVIAYKDFGILFTDRQEKNVPVESALKKDREWGDKPVSSLLGLINDSFDVKQIEQSYRNTKESIASALRPGDMRKGRVREEAIYPGVFGEEANKFKGTDAQKVEVQQAIDAFVANISDVKALERVRNALNSVEYVGDKKDPMYSKYKELTNPDFLNNNTHLLDNKQKAEGQFKSKAQQFEDFKKTIPQDLQPIVAQIEALSGNTTAIQDLNLNIKELIKGYGSGELFPKGNVPYKPIEFYPENKQTLPQTKGALTPTSSVDNSKITNHFNFETSNLPAALLARELVPHLTRIMAVNKATFKTQPQQV